MQQVHQDYLRVGADIITSNNFWTAPTRLERCGLGREWRRYARAAAENALKARDKLNPAAYVAGGIAAPTLQGPPESSPVSDTRQMGREACFQEWAEHAKLLVEMGVDLIQAEYVGFIEDCLTAVDACSQTGATVFLGIRHIRPDGTMQYGELLESLAEALEGRPVGAILLMCSNPEAISAGLPRLRNAFSGPSRRLSQPGYNPTGPLVNGPMLTNQKASSGPDILQNAEYYALTDGRIRRELEADGSPDYRRMLRLGTRAHQRHAAGGQRGRHRLIAGVSVFEIRRLEELYHPDRFCRGDQALQIEFRVWPQAHANGTVAFSECVSAGAKTKPSGIRTRTATGHLGAGNWRPPGGRPSESSNANYCTLRRRTDCRTGH